MVYLNGLYSNQSCKLILGGFFMNERLRQFFAGRYRHDDLNKFLWIIALAVMIVSMFVGRAVLYPFSLLLLLLCIIRMLSKNVMKRRRENCVYLNLLSKPTRWMKSWKRRISERKTHCFYKCSKCRVWVRVPKGRGLISITCPKCHTSFDKKT